MLLRAAHPAALQAQAPATDCKQASPRVAAVTAGPAESLPAQRLCLRPGLAAGKPSMVARSSSSNGASANRPSNTSSLAADLNSTCNAALQAMLANNGKRVPELGQRLQVLRLRALEQEQDLEADRLLRVVEGMLHHSVLKEADELRGPYAAALNRLINQVASSDWKLAMEGQSAEGGQQEPKFSTWEDVRKKQEQRCAGFGDGSTSSGNGVSTSLPDTAFYQLLGVERTASQADIKAAYRQLALRLHPDVSSEPDAAQRFAAVATAYDTLSDAEARKLYDQYGIDGMKRHAGSSAGSGNAQRFWDEFKPHKRVNKRTQARDASTASYGSSFHEPSGSGSGSGMDDGGAAAVASDSGSHGAGGVVDDQWAGMPLPGAVVEYPLSEVVRQELQDGRSHGLALLVGRNCDRGYAKRLPEDMLDLCEVEPLRQEDEGSYRWIPDELSPSAYARLGELRTVAVDSFDQRFDVWTITAPLSAGCAGPNLGEEVML